LEKVEKSCGKLRKVSVVEKMEASQRHDTGDQVDKSPNNPEVKDLFEGRTTKETKEIFESVKTKGTFNRDRYGFKSCLRYRNEIKSLISVFGDAMAGAEA
jgi:hypothetical protein